MTALDWFWSWLEGVPLVPIPELIVVPEPPKQPEFIVLSPVFNITQPTTIETVTAPIPTPVEMPSCPLCGLTVQPAFMTTHTSWHEEQRQNGSFVLVPVTIYHTSSMLTMKDYMEYGDQITRH